MYDRVKAFHIIAVIAWMAGMLYLPRLFVYHCVAEPGGVQSETLKIMERRLLKAIINPAMDRDLVAWHLARLEWRMVSRRVAADEGRTGLRNVRTARPNIATTPPSLFGHNLTFQMQKNWKNWNPAFV